MPRATSCFAVACCLLTGACADSRVDSAPETRAGAEPAPAAEVEAGEAVSFAVIGDFGTLDSYEHQVAQMVQGWATNGEVDFIITMGDNNYQSLSTTSYEQAVCKNGGDLYYGQFVRTTADASQTYCTASENVLFPTPGNHDWDSTHEYSKYTEFFPEAGTWDPGSGEYLQYAFGWPRASPVIQLFSLNVNCAAADSGGTNVNDDNHGCPLTGSGDCAQQYRHQVAWLERQLAATSAPWNLVYFHQPPHSYAGNEQDCQPIADAFDFSGRKYVNGAGYPLTAVFSGHSHVYERIVMNERSNRPYLIVGASGKLHSCNGTTPPSTVESAICYGDYPGAGLASVSQSQLTFEYFYQDGTLKDTCTWTYSPNSLEPELACAVS